MNSRIKFLLSFLFIAVVANAQGVLKQYERFLTTPRSYVCYRTNNDIKINGRLDEDDWEKAQPTESFVDISGAGFATPKYDTKAKMLWDDNYLYVGAILEEDDIKARLTQRDTIIYYDNDFEVFIDPDGDGHNYFEIETNVRGVIFDLMLDKPYRSKGNFMVQWDCPGLKVAIHCEGKLNNSKKADKYWSVEMAIPYKALMMNFNNPLKAGNCWRINFSRVQWLKEKGPEENWVWTPTGRIDMHMPDRWGYLYFSDNKVGKRIEDMKYPLNLDAYKLLWGMFYAQQDYASKGNGYIRTLKDFFLSDEDLKSLPKGGEISVKATESTYEMSISVPNENKIYSINNEGRFTTKEISQRVVKNWAWSNLQPKRTDEQKIAWFKMMKECGISAILFSGYDEHVYKMCKEAGLEAHEWRWTMNRGDLLKTHPDWFAVNRKGESCLDKPAYVNYYRFICPNHEGVATFLANDYVKETEKPYLDGVHLDYVRMPDVILPVGLWKNYNIIQTQELPEYDYCYCDVCRKKFKEHTGVDPLDMKYPQENQSWTNFRLNSINAVVDSITKAVKEHNKFISAAVFPGPSLARKMVRQDWGNWSLDAYFPMIYNKFYEEGIDWIGISVKESVTTVNGRAKIYAGLMLGDIRNEFDEALDEAFDNGADGVSFFSEPNEEDLLRLKKYIASRGFKVQ